MIFSKMCGSHQKNSMIFQYFLFSFDSPYYACLLYGQNWTVLVRKINSFQKDNYMVHVFCYIAVPPFDPSNILRMIATMKRSQSWHWVLGSVDSALLHFDSSSLFVAWHRLIQMQIFMSSVVSKLFWYSSIHTMD